MNVYCLKTAAAVLFTAVAVNYASAQNAQGITHNHPISDDLTKEYLQDYLGARCYNTANNEWGFLSTSNATPVKGSDGKNDPSNNTGFIAPTKVKAGEAIFVEINDWWKGVKNKSGSLYNQVKYGVKAMHNAGKGLTIGSGRLYHHDATTNRFFFAVRTNTCANGLHNSAFSFDQVSYNGRQYYLMSMGTSASPFEWYNEFSTCQNTSADGWDLIAQGAYTEMQDGLFEPVPHSCTNSMDRNHFSTLYGCDTIGNTHSISAFLYVPDGLDETKSQKGFTLSQQCYVFFYVNHLNGNLTVNSACDCGYQANLNWKTSFDEPKTKYNNRITDVDFVDWTATTAGVKEVSNVYRICEGVEGYDKYTRIATGLENDALVENKTWIDTTLPETEKGYYVDYYIVTDVYEFDKNGNRVDNKVATAATNVVRMYVPGSRDNSAFILNITGGQTSTFTPDAEGKKDNSRNDASNNIIPAVTKNTPQLNTDNYQANSTFEIVRTNADGTTTSVKKVTITENTRSGRYGNYTYTISYKDQHGNTGTWTGTADDLQDFLATVASATDNLNITPGEESETNYQLIYTPVGSSTPQSSNEVECRGLRTDVTIDKAFRSGTPDVKLNAVEERYEFDIKFRPIYGNDISCYYVRCKALDRVARIDQFSGGRFRRIYKGLDGNWNAMGEELFVDEDGMLSVHVGYECTDHVRVDEFDNSQSSDLSVFYTIEVELANASTYGNEDKEMAFIGNDAELVVNAQGEYTKAEKLAGAGREYRADITWSLNEDFAERLEQDNLEVDYYTVHRKMLKDGDVAYSPVTKRFTGEHNANHEAVYTEENADGIMVYPADDLHVIDLFLADAAAGDIVFPAVYYVKAHFRPIDETLMSIQTWFKDVAEESNFTIKNSNALYGMSSSIVTAVEDVNTLSPVMSETYYNMMGQKVTNPQPGTVVIVNRLHQDGTVTVTKKQI